MRRPRPVLLEYGLSPYRFVRSKALKRKVLQWSLTPSVKTQDFFFPMASVRLSSKDGADLAWDWLETNFSAVRSRVSTASSTLLASVLISCSRNAYTVEMAERVEKLMADNNLKEVIIDSCKREATWFICMKVIPFVRYPVRRPRWQRLSGPTLPSSEEHPTPHSRVLHIGNSSRPTFESFQSSSMSFLHRRF